MPDTLQRSGALIDPARLDAMMTAVSAFGGGEDGSMMRLTLSAEDGRARDWLGAWFAGNGFAGKIDPIGNQFGFAGMGGSNAPVVLVGSHLDSQPNGGRFDGALGVVSACEAIRAVREALERRGVLSACEFAVVNWTNEEGARFQPSLLGSSVFTGAAELDWALERRDGSGISVGEALSSIGYAGTDHVAVPGAYVELHIEGGPFLERENTRFGIFTRFWGATKYRLAFLGRQAHTGPTPMAERLDALLAGAHVVTGLKALAGAYGLDLHTSVGRLEVFPNSPNTVPSEAVLFIELRSGSATVLAEAEERLNAMIEAAAKEAGVGFEIRSVDRRIAGPMDAGLVGLAERSAAGHGVVSRHLDTIGGHDAVSLAAVCPSIVLAVPSVGGVIHHPTELTRPEDQAFGTQVLADMLMTLATDGLAALQSRDEAA
ncbi:MULTISPECIES: Zn-dependent hydrolase [unclassified Aureimonas]|uniref:Zn-dependent hydrolase n=1 Tax=unclassified Aureimonas TaxID=2615206 RepID=UPI0006F2B83D|nr:MULTISPECIES: Zn-dependent hydrolase [unclassified Aureimonas]KQT52496.1 Zn-dependent hydrolase [Aureimonas sp. Leaf427]KQT77603.1 Zn-dependent hydrolase [Aureimonas sp. Leaf460]